MLEGKNKFKIKNIANGRMLLASLVLEQGETFEVNPIFLSNETKKEIEYFVATGQLEVSIADVEESKAVDKEPSDVVSVETVKNDKAETHQHVVYDPNTASKNRVLAVDTVKKSKAIEVKEGNLDLVHFLESHWKTIERDLVKISDIEKLEKLLITADELGMKGNKKYELIKKRIEELK